MASLTSFLPYVSPRLGLSVATLYERQRELVRLGYLPQPTGRGRGSGAEATPETLTWILMSVLATDSLSQVGEEVASLAKAKIGKERGLFRKHPTFGVALEATLSNVDLAARVLSVTVNRRHNSALFLTRISFSGKFQTETVRFGVDTHVDPMPGLLIRAHLVGETIVEITKALQN